MKQSKTNKRLSVLCLAIAGVIGSAGVAAGQYQIDTSRATDANRRVGSAGYNDSVVVREYGAANLVTNNLVNGNITAGRGFRGSLGYADTRAFRGQLPSSSIDRFVQGSSGITTGGLPSFNSNVVRPYYGVGRGVNLPTAGSGDGAFTRDIGGGFVPATSRTFDPADGRIDYGGLDSALVQRSAFDTTRVANPLPASSQRYQMLSTSVRYRDAARLDPGGSVFLSEYTRIVRGSSLTPAEAKAVAELRERVSGAPAIATDAPPVEAGAGVGLTVRRAGEAARPAGVKPGENTQLDALRERFKLVADSSPTLPGAENAEQIRQLNAERIAERDAAARAEREAARNANRPTPPVRVTPTTPAPATSPDAPATAPDAPATSPESSAPTPIVPMPAAPSDPSVPVVAPTTDAANDAANPSATDEAATRTVVPGVEIKSFAAGINEPALASVMQRAEKLLAEGRYASAIIEIDNAELLAPRDPMLKLARSVAQLGGGYYRQAEISMREALDLDQALLVARYDLVSMIGEKRLETIRTDLARIAGESPADPGPLLMLAFVAHQTEPGTRGVELLRRAQRLAPADPLLPAILRVWEVSK